MQSSAEGFLLHVLIQLIVILGAARLGGRLMQAFGQPQVVGEILAGLLLGPSVLGRIAPDILGFVFPSDTAVVFRVLSELGLILFMFLIGLEFDFSHLRQVGRAAAGVATAGIALPFVLGAGLAWWIHPQVAAGVHRTGFVLIVAVALSITALPILGRIMVELGIQRTRLGTLTIAAAAIDDAVGWILLSGISTAIHGDFRLLPMLGMSALTILFVLGCRFLARPLLTRSTDYLMARADGDLSLSGLSAVLILVFLAAAATNAIGIFSIFGPFVLGAVLSDRAKFREAVGRRLRDLVYAMFLPIFFTYTGLRTDVGLLQSGRDWLICGLILVAAMAGKLGGCGLAARAGGLSWRDSGCVAVLMNTRALMGLIAINVGRELGVIPDNVFGMLVIMAVATTLITTPLLSRMLAPPVTTSA